MKILIGEKIEMSQVFDDKGSIQPVTLIKSRVFFVKDVIENPDGKSGRIVIGKKRLPGKTKGKKGSKKKAVLIPVRGFKVPDISLYKVGDKVSIDSFEKGDRINIFGVSKGKGFQGVVKRYNFGGDLKTHGRAHSLRKGGSIATKRLSKVKKGQKMPGRMGGKRICQFNSVIVDIDKDNKVIAVKGAVPGSRGTTIEIVTV